MTPTDRIRVRNVRNHLRLVQEHLEAMQRDVHGLEYPHWKEEVDGFWRTAFEEIGKMAPAPQQSVLEAIRGEWTTYLTHYAAIETKA